MVKKKSPDYGETDYDTKTIKINKTRHKQKNNHPSGFKKNKDGTASLVDTVRHEMYHVKYPKATEKQVRKKTAKWMDKATPKMKKKLYQKVKRK